MKVEDEIPKFASKTLENRPLGAPLKPGSKGGNSGRVRVRGSAGWRVRKQQPNPTHIIIQVGGLAGRGFTGWVGLGHGFTWGSRVHGLGRVGRSMTEIRGFTGWVGLAGWVRVGLRVGTRIATPSFLDGKRFFEEHVDPILLSTVWPSLEPTDPTEVISLIPNSTPYTLRVHGVESPQKLSGFKGREELWLWRVLEPADAGGVCGVVSIEANEAKQTTEPISCGVDIKVNTSRVVSFPSSPWLKLGFVNPLKNRGEEGNETTRDGFTLMSTPHDMGSVVCLGSVASLETTPHTVRVFCGCWKWQSHLYELISLNPFHAVSPSTISSQETHLLEPDNFIFLLLLQQVSASPTF
ncbi:hypothetical protein LXL04_009734 [Taraxacum kok-saghyz]